jgi:folate-binding protein YgfZ
MPPPETREPSLPPALAAARDAAVVCDLSPLAVIAISGTDAVPFLQGQLSCDVETLGEGVARYASYNSPKGRMLANLVLWREGPTDFRAVVAGDVAPAVRKRLSMYVLRSKVVLQDASAATVRFGLGGPRAADVLRRACGVHPEPMTVARTDLGIVIALRGPRYVLLAPPEQAAAASERLHRAAAPAPYSAWQWLTIRAGVPVLTAPLSDQLIAQTANWDLLDGVDFRKGCYTGQEVIARTQHLGRLKERLFAFHVDQDSVATATRVFAPAFGDQPCGIVVNAAPAPEGGNDLLAVVQLAAVEGGELHLGGPDGATLSPLPLPYEIPAPAPPRGRVGAPR